MIEDGASIVEVAELENAETDELEGVELGLGMAEGDEEGLELLQMVEMTASFEDR